VHGFYPSGGWGWSWAGGDPDRGFGRNQPAGWGYSVMPFLEQQTLYEMGKGLATTEKQVEAGKRNTIPLAMFNCPSRRSVMAFANPSKDLWSHYGATRMTTNARTDYCANAGSTEAQASAGKANNEPTSQAQADNPTYNWSDFSDHTGIIYVRSEVALAHIRDGASNTYLIGEKSLNPDDYTTGNDLGDNHVLSMGHNNDTVRWTYYNATTPSASLTPRQDRAGVPEYTRFGSAHAGSCSMAMCDGSVQSISYSIDAQVHANLGNRRDGQAASVPN
jgi:prepilin-type processing-associated H-X9-DG protein